MEAKHIVPEDFDGKEKGWKLWKEKVEMYVAVKNPEVKKEMDKVKGMAEDLGKEEGLPGELIWSFLKYKTKGKGQDGMDEERDGMMRGSSKHLRSSNPYRCVSAAFNENWQKNTG